MKDSKAVLGESIKMLRKLNGVSQNELAKLAGISQSGLSAIENGLSSPSVEMLNKILFPLGIDIHNLIPIDPETMKPIFDGYFDKHDNNINGQSCDKENEKRFDELFSSFIKLNIIGQEKVIAYIEGLLNNPGYVREEE